MAIKVDTGAVVSTANAIATKNTAIQNAFTSVETAMNQLNRNWDGSAADSAMRGFQNIKNTFCTSRYNVVDSLVKFMYNQVGQGYDSTESAVSSAASSFK